MYAIYYTIPIRYCPLIAYQLPLLHRFSAIMDMGPGPRTKTQELLGRGAGPVAFGPWAPVPGPYPLWLNRCASKAINRQYTTGDSYKTYIDI